MFWSNQIIFKQLKIPDNRLGSWTPLRPLPRLISAKSPNFTFFFEAFPNSRMYMTVIFHRLKSPFQVNKNFDPLHKQYKHFRGHAFFAYLGGGPEFGKTCLYNTCTLPNFLSFSDSKAMKISRRRRILPFQKKMPFF